MDKMTWNKFFESLRGVAVISRAGREIPKWQLYNMSGSHELMLISQKRDVTYSYIDKPGWRNGIMVPDSQ